MGLRFSSQLQELREQDQNSVSSLSISPSEYRSITSSPSLSAKRDYLLAQSPEPLDTSQPSAVNRQLGNSKQYNALEPKTLFDSTSQTGVSTDIELGENTSSPNVTGTKTQTSGSTIRSLQYNREKCATPPISVNFNGASSQISGFHSASPVSSLDSGSHFSTTHDNQISGFDAQLKASPLIRDMLDRLRRCETFALEIQHDLGEVHQKVNLLLERALVPNTQPEFKDPFASTSFNGNNLSPQFTAPRPSIGNIAPNQVPASDDITTISQRLNTLTSSVGQLLALQTQQLHANVELRSNSVINTNIPQPDLSPNQMLPSIITGHPVLGHGLPRQDLRPSPRSPNPPLRTWSAGNLDLPMRPGESTLVRQDPLARDKRRSVAVLRRESATVSSP